MLVYYKDLVYFVPFICNWFSIVPIVQVLFILYHLERRLHPKTLVCTIKYVEGV